MKPHISVVTALLLLGSWSAPPVFALTARPHLETAQEKPESPASLAKLPNGIERVTSLAGITEYKLANGLKVLLFPDQSKQTITVNMTYLVGSRHENYGETGMAHLLEHMLFKGTPKHPNIPEELDKRGGRYNATTSYDRTNYFEILQATDESLRWALELEADRMVNSFIAKKDLDSEMTVVRNEFELGENSPFSILLERIQSTAYLWHNYGNSTIGAREDIEKVPIERLQGFYRTYYQPDNAVLLLTGKFDEAKVLTYINETMGLIPKPLRALQSTYTLDPVQDGERAVTVRRTGDIQILAAGYHIPAGSHADFAGLELLSTILGDTPSGRLHKVLVDSGKATGVFGSNFQLREPGLALFGAVVSKDQSLDDVRDLFLKAVEQVTTQPVTSEEVERARLQALKNIELTVNSSDQFGLELSEWIAMGDWRLFFLHRDRMKKVTIEDVQRVANTYLIPSNRTLGTFIPTDKPVRAEIPASPDVAKLLEGFKSDEVVEAGEVFEPTPQNIESRVVRSETKGGIKLALLPKKTRGGIVIGNVRLHLGSEKTLTGRDLAGELVGQMLMRGTKKHTREQLQDELDRLKARLGVYGGATAVIASFEVPRENLASLMALVTEILREPAFPAAEFEKLRQENITDIESSRNEPEVLAQVALSKHLNPYPKGHINYVASPEEQIADLKALKLADVKKFHADFYGASFGEMAAIGDFAPKEVESLIENQFGDWKNPTPFERVADTFQSVSPINQILETPDKANAIFVAGLPLNLRDDDPDYPALVLGNYILGGSGTLNSRLGIRIRQKEGLSYGVYSTLYANSFDKTGLFEVSASCAPQNVKQLEVAFQEEMTRTLKDGFKPEEVEAAKAGYLESRKVSRAQDRELAGRLGSYRYLNRTFVWDVEFEAKIQALTPDQILQALRKHLDAAKISIVKAGDFAKKNQ